MDIVVFDNSIEIDGQPYKKGWIRPVQVGDFVSLLFPWYNNQPAWSGKWQDITFAGIPCGSAAEFDAFQTANFYPDTAAPSASIAIGSPVVGGIPGYNLVLDGSAKLNQVKGGIWPIFKKTHANDGELLPAVDMIILIDGSGGNVTLTLPDPATTFDATLNVSKRYAIKRIDAAGTTVRVGADAGARIDNISTQTFTALRFIEVVSDGANYWIV